MSPVCFTYKRLTGVLVTLLRCSQQRNQSLQNVCRLSSASLKSTVADDSLITCGWVNLLSPQSSVHRVATQGVARVNPRPAQLVLLSACLLVVRPVGHIDALSNLAAFLLNLLNSSGGSRKDFQWSIFVCHMSLTGQSGCCDIPAFDYHSAHSNDVAATVHVSGFPFLTSSARFSHGTFPVTQ